MAGIKTIKEWWKKTDVVSKWKEIPLKKKVFAGGVAFLVLIPIIGMVIYFSGKEEITYVETTVILGDLTVGIEETGNVSVEEEEQIFDIDISEFSSDNSSGFEWQNSGGNGMMTFGIVGFGDSQNADNRELLVEEVYVSAGQEITAGTPICSFTEESLSTIRNGLVDDEAAAGSTLKERETDLTVSELSANQELETNLLYGEAAQIEYDAAIRELNDKVTEAEEQLEESQEALTESQEELVTKQEALAEATKVLENAEYIADAADMKSGLYMWTVEMQNYFTAKDTVESLEKEIESLEETIKQTQMEISSLQSEVVNAKKSYETGKVEAQAVYDTRMLKYNAAQEIYDTAIASTSLNYEIALEEYEEAKAKLDEFNAVVVENNLIALSDGVISEVSVEAGSSVYKNSSIITYNAYEDVSITVTLEEEDREQIAVGSLVNVTIPALDDTLFGGEVSEIGDAVYDTDSATNTYEVTVSLSGELEKVFDGMSAELTFVTEEQKNVLYVLKRAILEKNEKTYVKVREESGKMKTVEVETGFSDGINIEVISGLTEGEVVLMESKVSGS